jgi:3-dehydroquinate synthase
MKKSNIVLTGFMGVGKTEVGRRLAELLEMKFIDTDTAVESAVGMKIPDIFQKYGEERFRCEEAAVIRKAALCSNCVIATGGGVVLNPENMRALREKGMIILLSAQPSVIADRVMKTAKRPLLQGDDLNKRIRNLLSERAPCYQDCDDRIDTSELSIEQVVERIISLLDENQETGKTGILETVPVDLKERGYSIKIGAGNLECLGEAMVALEPLQDVKSVLVVTDERVGPLYGKQVLSSLKRAGFSPLYHQLPEGEEYKSLESAEQLYTAAIENGLDRQSAVVALGGGVVGDLAGFVASTYMRGISLIQVPTTLLAQVDSSVGGKVAVNHPLGKNMIGAFYQPQLVFIDVHVLETLAPREVRAGLAEVIKYGVIRDGDFFSYLEGHLQQILALDEGVLSYVIKKSCAIKARVVEEDEREDGVRAFLNFGHTIGHALEALTFYRNYRHGEAVAAGMVAAAEIAVERGLLEEEEKNRLKKLLDRAGLPVTVPLAGDEILNILPRDKKARHGRPRFVLPLGLGSVNLFEDVETDEIRAALERCRKTE